MTQETRRARHARLYQRLRAMEVTESEEGLWPHRRLPNGAETTGFVPRPDTVWAEDVTSADLDRLEAELRS